MRFAELVWVPPVQVQDQALLVEGHQLAQQLLLFPVQTQVVGDGEGLQGQAGEALHLFIVVQMQTEVVPGFYSSGHNSFILQHDRIKMMN